MRAGVLYLTAVLWTVAGLYDSGQVPPSEAGEEQPAGGTEPPGLVAALGKHHAKSIYALAFSPDGGLLATGSQDKSIAVWNISQALKPTRSGKPSKPKRQLHGHVGGVTALAFAASGNDLVLASGGAGAANGTGGELRLWSARSGRLLRILEHPRTVFGVAAPRGHGAAGADAGEGSDLQLATACWDGLARIFAWPSGDLRARLDGHEGGLYSVVYSPLDPTLLATASADRTVRVWDARTMRQLWVLGHHKDHVTSVDWSPRDPLTLASGGWDRRFRLWEIGREEQVACRSPGGTCSSSLAPRASGKHPQLVWRVAFEPGGQFVAACHGAVGQSPTVVLYSVATGRVVRRLGRHKDTPLVVGWSPDGRLLASAGMDRGVLVYDGRSPLDDLPGGDPDDEEERQLWREDLDEYRTGVRSSRDNASEPTAAGVPQQPHPLSGRVAWM